jgi:hypothetical protein
MPGKYTVVLTVDGKSYTQPLTVEMDPRVKTPARDLAEQFRLSKQLYDQWLAFNDIADQVKAIRKQLADLRSSAKANDVKSQVDSLNQKLDELVGPESRRPDPAAKLTTQSATAKLRTLFSIIQDVDVAPTPQVAAAVAASQTETKLLMTKWQAIRSQDISALNQQLRAAGLPPINVGVTK